MCDICRQYFCPSSCPSFVGRSAELGRTLFRCILCGGRIYENDSYMINYGKPYCYRCMKSENENRKEEKKR